MIAVALRSERNEQLAAAGVLLTDNVGLEKLISGMGLESRMVHAQPAILYSYILLRDDASQCDKARKNTTLKNIHCPRTALGLGQEAHCAAVVSAGSRGSGGAHCSSKF